MDEMGLTTRRSVVAAWMSMLWFVPAFFGAFLAGEGLIGLMGYPVGGPTAPPMWPGLGATVAALVVFALPLWPVVHFARRAERAGARSARGAVILTVVIIVGFAVPNLVPLGQ